MANKKELELLNQVVADLTQGTIVIHQAHWYMRGRGFMKFHPLMDEYMDQLNEVLDEVSERLITLGGSPYSTLEEYVEHTKFKSEKATWDLKMEDHLARVVELFRYLTNLYQEAMDVTDEAGDDVTNDIFVGAKANLEKAIWMLQAELNQAPNL